VPTPPRSIDLFLAGDSSAPRLLHPPRGRAWWSWGHRRERAIVDDGTRLWVERDDRWTAWDFKAVRVLVDGERAVAIDRHERALNLVDGSIQLGRVGLDGGLRPTAVGWKARHEDWEIPFFQAYPWTHGRGAIGCAEGVVYRMEAGRCRAVGFGTRLIAGPHGAFATVDQGWCTAAAAPRCSARPLPVPVRDDAWVRWSDSGTELLGLDPSGACVHHDLRSGRYTRVEGALPVDVHTRLYAHGDRVGSGPTLHGIREFSWALSAPLLAGPAGVTWDLRTGTRCFEIPVLEFGATIATPNDWITVHWHDGRGRRFDPRTGRVKDSFQLPLAPEEVVESGHFDGDRAWMFTSAGRAFTADDPDHPVDADPPADEPTLHGALEEHAAGLSFDASAAVNGRVYGWNTDGLLVSVAER
jgi:hypothetical protein